MARVDRCTAFPERWPAWVSPWRWRVIEIAPCCKLHDERCSTGKFYRCLRNRRVVGAWLITVGGAIGCWAKYPKKMINRVN